MGSSLLMGCKDMPYLVLMLVKCIVKVQGRTAGISEYGINALLLQALYDYLCSAYIHTLTSFLYSDVPPGISYGAVFI